MGEPAITHVIPAHNEERYLPRTLQSVRRAVEAFGQAVEVIVVDNASTDATAEIARNLGAHVVYESQRCIAAARNAGAAAARGRIVTFADADSLLSENFFVRVHDHMASGRWIGGNCAVRPERRSLAIDLTFGIVVRLVRLMYGVGGGSYFCLKRTFDSIGGFDARMPYGEDVTFGRALRRYGRRQGLGYVQDSEAYIITSMRKADRLGDWHALRFMLMIPLYALRPSAARRRLHAYFYEFDKGRVRS